MKNIRIYLIGFALLMAVSCNDHHYFTENGSVSLALTQVTSNSGRTQALDNVSKFVISVTDAHTSKVFDMKELTVLTLDGQYVSEQLQLPVGTYTITEFYVTDINNNILAMTPKENSQLSSFVSDPLPITFEVTKSQTNNLAIEVISTTNTVAIEFGVSTFGISDKPVTALFIHAGGTIGHLDYQLTREGENISGSDDFSTFLLDFNNPDMIGKTYDMKLKLFAQPTGNNDDLAYFYSGKITFTGAAVELPFFTLSPWQIYYYRNSALVDIYFPFNPLLSSKYIIDAKSGNINNGLISRLYSNQSGLPLTGCGVDGTTIPSGTDVKEVDFPNVCMTQEINYSINSTVTLSVNGQSISQNFQWFIENSHVIDVL